MNLYNGRLVFAGLLVVSMRAAGVGLLPAQASQPPPAPSPDLAIAASPAAGPTPGSSSSAPSAGTPAPGAPAPTYPADYDLANGHFYTQTNGGSSPAAQGYSVTDEGGIPMWSEFRRLGGVGALGYPISTRYQDQSFVQQAFQKGILQWRPDQNRAVRMNVMDMLHDAGKDAALQSTWQIPPPRSAGVETGQSWSQILQARESLLDFPNSGFKDMFNSVPDPLGTFGLPTSVITDEGPMYAVRLQRTVFQLWKSDQPWAKANTVTAVNAGDLAKENGIIPAAAMQPEPGRMVVGEAARRPWSGWLWPSSYDADGPHLSDAGGPLSKYDDYVKSLHKPDPATRQWEVDHFAFSDPSLDWVGKCNGWAVAALTEPEPVKPRTVNGITFSVADQKGLLTDYHFADSAAWLIGGKDGGVKAADFHRTLLDWVGKQRLGLVMNAFDATDQVASFAVYRFQAVYMADPGDPANKTHVRMTVWAADYHVDPNFVGLKIWPDDKAKTYSYFIYGDRTNPTAGDWEGDSVVGDYAHPENLWYPSLDPANRNLFRQLTSPNLDYATIQQIIKP